jgi:anti-anti-sigma regulatory factor
MSATTAIQAHIAYELIDDTSHDVMVIEFVSNNITGSVHSRELGEQLNSLIQPSWPQYFVLDFANVRALGSMAFGEIASFAQKVKPIWVCNLDDTLRLGASLIGLDDCAEFSFNRRAAIEAARSAATIEEYVVS